MPKIDFNKVDFPLPSSPIIASLSPFFNNKFKFFIIKKVINSKKRGDKMRIFT